VVLLIHMNDFMWEMHVSIQLLRAGEGGDGVRVLRPTRMGHLSFHLEKTYAFGKTLYAFGLTKWTFRKDWRFR